MGKRAAVVFTCLAVVVFQYLWSSHAQPLRSYVPLVASPPMAAFQPRMPAPHMKANSDRVLDQDWSSGRWDYDTPFTQEDVQRRVMERLFRKNKAPAVEDPSKDAALQAAAQEVYGIATTFGQAEGDFAEKWVAKVMASQDPRARLDIIDECFVDMDLDCQGLEDALRRFRMLLAPHTALVQEAKKEVLFQAGKQDGVKQAFIDDWMKKVESGKKATPPSEVLEECLISTAMEGPRSKDCFEFEEALRNYKAAAELWTKDAPKEKPLGNRMAAKKDFSS
jgi:hypothetical protein